MTSKEVLSEIQKLPPSEARRVAEQLNRYLHELEQTTLIDAEIERREDEFEQYLLAEGIIGSIPTRKETDEDDDFEPVKFEGEPLSEMIIRERR